MTGRGVHAYVDESKAKGYLLVAAVGFREPLQAARKELRNLVLPGQRALHMRDENDSRRRQIADVIATLHGLGATATLYDAGKRGANEKERRARCLAALVEDLVAEHHHAHITLDRDETMVSWDRQTLLELTRSAHVRERVTYGHSDRQTELLLAISRRGRLVLGPRR